MDAIEKAIRNALEKGDAGSQAYRERVYNSAFAALERALSTRESISPEAAEQRRKNLRAKIIEIETEFVPATDRPSEEVSTAEPAPAVEASQPVAAPAEPPSVDSGDRLQPPGEQSQDTQSEIVADTRPRRRPFATMFIIVLLLAAIGTGAWWTIQSGILVPADERNGSVPNPPPELNGENFRPEKILDGDDGTENSDIPRDWITIFEPDNSTEVTVPGGTDARLVERDGENYLRISTSGEAEILFDIGEGTLERIAGGQALFSISARAQEEEVTQISVACDLGELGNCGRKRYEVGAAISELLFELELPGREPGAAGTVAINPDISGSGRMLDIKDIRVAITQ